MLICAGLVACGYGLERDDVNNSEQAIAGLGERARIASAKLASTLEKRSAALRLLCHAASEGRFDDDPASNPATYQARLQPFAEASELLLGERIHHVRAADYVAETLSRVSDPRAADSLVVWVSRSSTSKRDRRMLLSYMMRYPRAAYLAAVRAILAQPLLAGEVIPTGPGGALGRVVNGARYVSVQAAALGVASMIKGEPARAVLREVVLNRKFFSPDPVTLEALRCPGKSTWLGLLTREESEALASLRLVALGLLDDRALMESIAKDPSEPVIMRRFATRMVKMPSRMESPPGAGGFSLDGVKHIDDEDAVSMKSLDPCRRDP